MSSDKEDQPPAYTPKSGAPAPAGYPPPTGYSPQAGVSGQNTSTVIVTQPGQAGVTYSYTRPPDYLAASIFATLCCFWPTGLCAIYYASKAQSAANTGNIAVATRLSKNARSFMITSIVAGVILITIVVILRVLVINSGKRNRY